MSESSEKSIEDFHDEGFADTLSKILDQLREYDKIDGLHQVMEKLGIYAH